MDLRSGHSYWLLKNGLLASYPSLRADVDCDVAIIGAGISGALVGYHLCGAGVDTLVIDRRDVATGSTAASTALLQHAADTELVELIGKVGENAAVRSYRLGLAAVSKIEKLTQSLGDACGFERKTSLYLASAKSHVAKLKQEFGIRQRHGFEVEFLDAADIAARYPFPAPAAILAKGDAQIDGYRFTHRLLEHASRAGLRVFDRTGIAAITPCRGGMALTTDEGHHISARRVVFATGYESQRFLKQRIGDLFSTFALITEPIEPFPNWPDRCLIWETARPYCYLRATEEGRILMGGKDVPFATAHRQDGLVRLKTAQLARRLQRMFTGTEFEVAYAWAGTFGTTDDGLAYIGVSPEWPHAYFALGYGGNGITMSLLAAEIIRDHYLGQENADAKIFSFAR